MPKWDTEALCRYFAETRAAELEQIRADVESELRRLDAADELTDAAYALVMARMDRRVDDLAQAACDQLIADALALYRVRTGTLQ
jgi:hypothetical protein